MPNCPGYPIGGQKACSGGGITACVTCLRWCCGQVFGRYAVIVPNDMCSLVVKFSGHTLVLPLCVHCHELEMCKCENVTSDSI